VLYDKSDIKIIHAVFGFFGALGSGRGWRLYLLFSRGRGVDVCLVNVSRAEVDRFVGSMERGSGSSENDDGSPLYVAISRCRARRCPSLKFNVVRSSSVMSTTVSQLWKPFSVRIWRYSVRASLSSTPFKFGIVELQGEAISMTWVLLGRRENDNGRIRLYEPGACCSSMAIPTRRPLQVVKLSGWWHGPAVG
jgi:hypothetical protein